MVTHKQRIPFCDLSQLDEKDREMADRDKVDGEVVNIFKAADAESEAGARLGALRRLHSRRSIAAGARTRDRDSAHRLAQPGGVRMGAARANRQAPG